MSFFSIANTLFKSLVKEPATNMYPLQKQKYKIRTRGHIDIVIDKCIFCSICMRRCPTGAIEVSKDHKSWSINRLKCIQCNSCVEACPKQCLTMENSYTPVSTGEGRDEFYARIPDNEANHSDSE